MNQNERIQKQIHAAIHLTEEAYEAVRSNVVGRRVRILTDFNGQPFGSSWPSLKGEIRVVTQVIVERSAVYLFLDDKRHLCGIRAREVEFLEDEDQLSATPPDPSIEPTGPANAPKAENHGETDWDSIDQADAIEILARELYAMRFAPIPATPAQVKQYHAAMELRRGMFDTEPRRPVWLALAGDVWNRIFEGGEDGQES